MISFVERCYSYQYDEISDDEFSDDEISGFANTVNPRLSATRLFANFGHSPQIYWDILL